MQGTVVLCDVGGREGRGSWLDSKQMMVSRKRCMSTRMLLGYERNTSVIIV